MASISVSFRDANFERKISQLGPTTPDNPHDVTITFDSTYDRYITAVSEALSNLMSQHVYINIIPDFSSLRSSGIDYTPCIISGDCIVGVTFNDLVSKAQDNNIELRFKSENLTSISGDLSAIRHARYMFAECTSLTEIPEFPNLRYADSMFWRCTGLQAVDFKCFPSLVNASEMFDECTNLKYVNVPESSSSTIEEFTADYMFHGCTSLETFNFGYLLIKKAVSMFQGCENLKSIDITSIVYLTGDKSIDIFEDCSSLEVLYCNIPISDDIKAYWSSYAPVKASKIITTLNRYVSDISSFPENTADDPYDVVVDYAGGDYDNESELSLAIKEAGRYVNIGFSHPEFTSKLSYCFYNNTYITAIALTETLGIEDASFMFYGCSNLKSIKNLLRISRAITNVESMFSGCSNLISIDVTNFGKVTNVTGMIDGCDSLFKIDFNEETTSQAVIDYINENFIPGRVKVGKYTEVISSLDENTVDTPYDVIITDPENIVLSDNSSNIASSIQNAGRYVNIRFTGTYNNTDARYMFNECTNIISIDTSIFTTVTNADRMFAKCTNITAIDTSPFANIIDANGMFFGCTNLASINTSVFTNVTGADHMFTNCQNLTSIDASAFSNVTSAEYMFSSCLNLISVDGASFSSAINAAHMFHVCQKLMSINNPVFTNVTDASYMFCECKSLESVDATTFINVTNGSRMFHGCIKLASIDTSAFRNLTNANWMFYKCAELTSIDVSSFTNVTDTTSMLSGCSGLESITYSKASTSQDVIDYLNDKYPDILIALLEMTIAEYTDTIGSLDENTADAPYAVTIIDPENIVLNDKKTSNLGLEIQKAKRYVGIKLYGTYNNTDAEYMFYGCSYLTSIDTASFTNVADASFMFSDCTSLTSIDTSSFTSVTNARFMFYGCSSLASIDASPFTKVTNAYGMFCYCNSLTSIEASSFINVTDASSMFFECKSLTSIDTSSFVSVTKASSMFSECSNLTSIDALSFTSVTDASGMFFHCINLTTVDAPSFTSAVSASSMFEGCSSLTSIDASSFTNATNAGHMFDGCSNLTSVDMPSFTNVTNALRMFAGCSALTSIDASSFTNVTNASYMFRNCSNLTSINASSFTNATDTSKMFDGCVNLTSVDVPSFANVTNAIYMFYNCSSLTSIDTSSFTNVVSASYMFYGCSSLVSIDAFSFTSVTNANGMFEGCNNLTSIDAPSFVNATSTSRMFFDCSSLTSVDTSSFTKVTNADSMFCYCSSLTSIDTSPFVNVMYSGTMFYNCSGLTSIDTRVFKNVLNATAMFYNCSGLSSIDTASFTNVLGAEYMFYGCNFTYIDLTYLSSVTIADNILDGCFSLKLITYDPDITSEAVVKYITSKFSNIAVTPMTLTVSGYETKVKTLPENFTGIPFVVTISDISSIADDSKRALLRDAINNSKRYVKLKFSSDFTGTSAYSAFSNCTYLTDINLSAFNSVTDASFMLWGCNNLKSVDVSNMDNTVNAQALFYGCSSLESIDTSGFTKVEDARSMFRDCVGLSEIDTTPFNSITSASEMFEGCTNLEYVDTACFSEITDGLSMFYMCENLKDIDTSVFSKLNSASSMFAGCKSITSVDASVFGNVTDARYMFAGCESLTEVKDPNFSSVTTSEVMFSTCKSLENVDVSSLAKTTNVGSMFKNCASLKGIDTRAFKNVTNANNFINGCTSLKFIDISPMTKVTSWTTAVNGNEGIEYMYYGKDTPADFVSLVSTAAENAVMLPIAISLDDDEPFARLQSLPENTIEYDNPEKHWPYSVSVSAITNDSAPRMQGLNDCERFVDISFGDNFVYGDKTADGILSDIDYAVHIDTAPFKNVDSAKNMLSGCINLKSIDLSPFKIGAVKSNTIEGCIGLEEIILNKDYGIMKQSLTKSSYPMLKKVTARGVVNSGILQAPSDISKSNHRLVNVKSNEENKVVEIFDCNTDENGNLVKIASVPVVSHSNDVYLAGIISETLKNDEDPVSEETIKTIVEFKTQWNDTSDSKFVKSTKNSAVFSVENPDDVVSNCFVTKKEFSGALSKDEIIEMSIKMSGAVGELRYFPDTTDRAGFKYADGSIFLPDVYPEFFAWWKEHLERRCGYDNNGYPRLPDLRDMYIAGRGKGFMNIEHEMLPNLTGTFGTWNQWVGDRIGTGVFSAWHYQTSTGFGSSGNDARTAANIDASRVHTAYGQEMSKQEKPHVRPKSVTSYIFIKMM